MPIHVLTPEVAARIAAGEVVERPASVVKELLENSLDAGAAQIEIRVDGGGQTQILVADNGVGIGPEEIELAVARHATSKLRSVEDLQAIRTLGFRGEALASIAAVSRFEIQSREAKAEAGRRLFVEGSNLGRPETVGAPPGTLVRVRELFFNVPARKKFLRSEANERRRIHELVGRYALAYPYVRFDLWLDGRLALHADGRGDRRQVLAAALGADLAAAMIAVPEARMDGMRVEGYVSPPEVHRSTRREISFFVNGRWVQDARLGAAVVQAYHSLLMVGRYPVSILFLELPPDQVDVNVHPAKSEVRFRSAEAVFGLVQRAVRATLLRQTPPEFDLGGPRWLPGRDAGAMALPDPAWELAHPEGPALDTGGATPLWTLAGRVPLLRVVGQVGAAYLVAEGPDGLYLIDQHAAHERVLFEKLHAQMAAGTVIEQALLQPRMVELTPTQAELLETNQATLRALGYEVEGFGTGAFRVRTVPGLLANLDPELALRALVEDFEEDERPLEAEHEARLAARVCKRAAIKAGQVLSLKEQEALVRGLEACATPRTCPHGRPTLIHISVDLLERQFGRRG